MRIFSPKFIRWRKQIRVIFLSPGQLIVQLEKQVDERKETRTRIYYETSFSY